MKDLVSTLVENHLVKPLEPLKPWKPKGLPVAEMDCDLSIPGQGSIAVTLRVWGRFTPFHAGGHEPGERPYEPDDPASFEVEAIFMGETDITAELGQRGEEIVSQYCMENCE